MQPIEANPNLIANFSLRELTEILIKHQKIKEGLYDLAFEFQIAVGAMGPTPESICPGAMIGISHIGLSKTEVSSVNTVDASVSKSPKKMKGKS